MAAVRFLDQPGLEVYTALFSLNQAFSFFLFGLVLLPIASSTGKEAGKQLGISIVLLGTLLVIFAVVSPLAMHFFSSFDGRITPHVWLLSFSFFASQCAYEAARWLTIRLRGARKAFAVTMTRFALFFIAIFLIGGDRLDATNFTAVQIAVNAVAMIGFSFTLREVLHEVHLAVPNRRAFLHLANFGTSVANFATNFATVALVDRGFGGAGLAAFQALRSATNPIGLLSQVIDNHFSAYLARTGKGITVMGRAMWLALAGSAFLLILAAIFGPLIVDLFFGGDFAGYWLLLPLLLLASLAHALTRPTFVKWRLAGDTCALNIFSILQITIVLPALAVLGWSGWTHTMIGLFALQPITAVVVDALRNKTK